MWQSLETRKSKWWQHRWLWATSELARSAREPLYLKFFVKKCLSGRQTTLPKAKDKPRCMIFQGNKVHQFCRTGVWRKLREVHGLKDPSECKCSWLSAKNIFPFLFGMVSSSGTNVFLIPTVHYTTCSIADLFWPGRPRAPKHSHVTGSPQIELEIPLTQNIWVTLLSPRPELLQTQLLGC